MWVRWVGSGEGVRDGWREAREGRRGWDGERRGCSWVVLEGRGGGG